MGFVIMIDHISTYELFKVKVYLNDNDSDSDSDSNNNKAKDIHHD